MAAGDVTIDLNGYTLTATTESGKNVVTVEEGASLTITGGTIKNEYTGNSSIDNSAAIYSEGTLVLDGVTIESSSVGVRAVSGTVDMTDTTIESGYWAIWESAGTVTVTLGEGTVITGDDKTIFVGGDADYGYDGYQVGAVTTLIVDGATIESNGESAISTFGTATSSSAIVIIKSGTITGYADDTTACPAVYIPNGTLYVYGGTITGSTALEIRGGTAYICGGEFISSYEEEPNAAYNTSGATTMGYALAVYPYKSTMRDSDTNFNNDVAVYVSGGSFTGAVYAADKSEVGDYTFVISAGFFTVQPAEALLAEGYAAYRTGDGTGYTVVEDISGTWMLTNFKYTVIPVFGVVYVDVTLEISNDGTFTFTIKDIRWGGDSMIYPYTVCSDNSWYVNADGTFSFVILEGEDGKNENIANVKLGEDENGDECLLLSFTLNLGELDDLDLGGLESLASAITITVTDAEIYKANV